MGTDPKTSLADAILEIVVTTGDVIGIGASGEHFLLIAVPNSVYSQLSEHRAELEDLEPDDNGDNSDDEESLQPSEDCGR